LGAGDDDVATAWAGDESEDLVQETFLRAWKSLGGFEGRSTLRAWLYYRAFAITVLRIEDGRIVEATAFHDPDLFATFALPTALPPTHR